MRDARVRCNQANYDWEGVNGNEIERKDIFVGDSPSAFFPFMSEATWLNPSQMEGQYATWHSFESKQDRPEETQGAVIITATERKSRKIIFRLGYVFPKGGKEAWIFNPSGRGQPVFKASIRIIAEGIEEVRDYSVSLSMNNIRISGLDSDSPSIVTYAFELRKI